MTSYNLIRLSVFVFLYSTSFVQSVQAGNAGMTEEQMQQLMQNVEKMQECFAKMDQAAMQSLTAKGEKMQAEVKTLCATGKRDKAQSKVIEYGKEIANSKEMQEMQKCGEMAQQMMQQMPKMPGGEGSAYGDHHVCNGL